MGTNKGLPNQLALEGLPVLPGPFRPQALRYLLQDRDKSEVTTTRVKSGRKQNVIQYVI